MCDRLFCLDSSWYIKPYMSGYLSRRLLPKQHSHMGPSQAQPGPNWGPTWPNWGPTGAHMECCLGRNPAKSVHTVATVQTYVQSVPTERTHVHTVPTGLTHVHIVPTKWTYAHVVGITIMSSSYCLNMSLCNNHQNNETNISFYNILLNVCAKVSWFWYLCCGSFPSPL